MMDDAKRIHNLIQEVRAGESVLITVGDTEIEVVNVHRRDLRARLLFMAPRNVDIRRLTDDDYPDGDNAA